MVVERDDQYDRLWEWLWTELNEFDEKGIMRSHVNAPGYYIVTIESWW